MSSITCPEFTSLYPDIITDFNLCVGENIDEIEECIYKLDSNDDPDLIYELFRGLHSLKGNFRMVMLFPFVSITHELEEIICDMREGRRPYHQIYGSVIISVVSLIEVLTKQLELNGYCNKKAVDSITAYIKQIGQTKANPTNDDLLVADNVLTELIKLQEDTDNFDEDFDDADETDENNSELTENPENLICKDDAKLDLRKKKNNLLLFKDLASQQDGLSIYRKGRVKEVLKLCLAINNELENQVDPEQLMAAVYIHDFGMAFVPTKILHKQESLSREEVAVIRKHVNTGADLLLNMEGWQDAAEMVCQHHERFDGTGYPKGLEENEIHPGAVLISLADTYCAITNERSDRSYKKSLFSAVTLINSESGKQFSPYFVECFNETIRKLYIHPG